MAASTAVQIVSVILILGNLAASALEYAPYTVIKTAPDYEERFYPSRKWVSTAIRAVSQDDVRSTQFWRLFRYISEANDADARIPMTAPVTTRIPPEGSSGSERTFVMSFFLPEAFQSNPPAPTNSEVFIEDRDEFTVFVRRFGGFAQRRDWLNQAAILRESLRANNETVAQEEAWFTAGYNAPYVLFNRRNEVWIKKQSVNEI